MLGSEQLEKQDSNNKFYALCGKLVISFPRGERGVAKGFCALGHASLCILCNDIAVTSSINATKPPPVPVFATVLPGVSSKALCS